MGDVRREAPHPLGAWPAGRGADRPAKPSQAHGNPAGRASGCCKWHGQRPVWTRNGPAGQRSHRTTLALEERQPSALRTVAGIVS